MNSESQSSKSELPGFSFRLKLRGSSRRGKTGDSPDALMPIKSVRVTVNLKPVGLSTPFELSLTQRLLPDTV